MGRNGILSLFAGAALCCASYNCAFAWKYEEFTPGMTDSEVSDLLRRKGFGDLIRAPIEGRGGEYVLQSRMANNKYHVTLCKGTVSGLSIDIGTDFHLFAIHVRMEKKVRGEPVIEVIQAGIYSMVTAEWVVANEKMEYAYELVVGDKQGRVALTYTAPNSCAERK